MIPAGDLGKLPAARCCPESDDKMKTTEEKSKRAPNPYFSFAWLSLPTHSLGSAKEVS
ncbi:Rint1 [Phodopus roborovskii]|uniref:Rint1 protein n=1 Tax=Phodopus roborovskii TaxID=109678 RepID=A0AAV0ACD3_PHORO|nr:Rint1 [Phodopus roborovskii]